MAVTKFFILSILVLYVCQVFGGISEEKCLEYSKQFSQDKIEENIDGPKTEIGKEPAAPGEFPHMALLLYSDEAPNSYCGGSLISDKYILTIGRCAAREKPITAVLGEHNVTSTSDDENVQKINIKNIILHPSYKLPEAYNDIALLELSEPAKLNRFVRPACLHQKKALPFNSELVATGWGLLHYQGEKAETLQKVYLDTFTSEECQKAYTHVSKRMLPNGIQEETMICAGGKTSSKDTCQGDSGGPLQYLDIGLNSYEIVGLVSFGKSCGIIGVPSVYTRVSAYIQWIEENVWKK